MTKFNFNTLICFCAFLLLFSSCRHNKPRYTYEHWDDISGYSKAELEKRHIKETPFLLISYDSINPSFDSLNPPTRDVYMYEYDRIFNKSVRSRFYFDIPHDSSFTVYYDWMPENSRHGILAERWCLPFPGPYKAHTAVKVHGEWKVQYEHIPHHQNSYIYSKYSYYPEFSYREKLERMSVISTESKKVLFDLRISKEGEVLSRKFKDHPIKLKKVPVKWPMMQLSRWGSVFMDSLSEDIKLKYDYNEYIESDTVRQWKRITHFNTSGVLKRRITRTFNDELLESLTLVGYFNINIQLNAANHSLSSELVPMYDYVLYDITPDYQRYKAFEQIWDKDGLIYTNIAYYPPSGGKHNLIKWIEVVFAKDETEVYSKYFYQR